jgi:hypothetical protein
MPLTEMTGLLAAVAEDYPPTALTALLADSLARTTHIADIFVRVDRYGRPPGV